MKEQHSQGSEVDHPQQAASKRHNSHLLVTIVSAQYVPCEGKRTSTTSTPRLLASEQSTDNYIIRYSRDVTPFLKALLLIQQRRELLKQHGSIADHVGQYDTTSSNDTYSTTLFSKRQQAVVFKSVIDGGMKRTQIRILESGMNAVFGDPCPGTSKRLFVTYLISERNDDDDDDDSDKYDTPPVNTTSALSHQKLLLLEQVASTEVHHLEFAEHEPVVLRQRVNFSTRDRLDGSVASKRIPSTSQLTPNELNDDDATVDDFSEQIERPKLPRFDYDTILPLILSFLQVKERVQCQLVATSWRNIIRQWGVATTIDRQDPAFYAFTRPLLRGLVSHSFASLHSLLLGGMDDLQKSDLNPSIPHLKLLRSLDLSFCKELDDETMCLLATHTKETLQVLYIKGLSRVTDAGVIDLCMGCSQLQVLEVSFVPITDRAGVEMGRRLLQLKALYMRDNYQLTNASVDVITANCTHLEQLTLWGCTRLTHLQSFAGSQSQCLIMLNLWGCHSLTDDASSAMAGLTQLRSLIVSECHRLTDQFVVDVGRYVSGLHHFSLRYCKRVTDVGVLHIAHHWMSLYSLDLSFCSRVTIMAIAELLLRVRGLTELRLAWCKGLDVVNGENGDLGRAGHELLRAARSEDSRLSVLDVTHCCGRAKLDVFTVAMKSLDFVQKSDGYFCRPARWTADYQDRMVKDLSRLEDL